MSASAQTAEVLTSQQAAVAAGVPFRSLMNWLEAGLLRPPGYRGKPREPVLWPPSVIREARTIAALRAAGLSMQRIRQAIGFLRGRGFNAFSSGKFLVVNVHDGTPEGLVRICEDGDEALELIGTGQGQLCFRLWSGEGE